ncbi:MAG: PfkB family carbohydrate kinase [Armatimonadota bacterium]
MADVVTLGEALIDFISLESDVSLVESPGFKKAPGGAPANVAASVARLGRESAFIGKVGDDPFGRFLARTFAAAGVDTSPMVFDKDARTGLAFVALRPGGVPDFLFYPGAHSLLRPEELDRALLNKTKIFHHGSISLISEPARSATFEAARLARDGGAIVSYDPNLRLSLWESAEAAKAGMLSGLPGAVVVKLSEEELEFLTGETDLPAGARALMRIAETARLVLVTRGPNGCYYATERASGFVPGVTVEPVDTTGAGDAFVGAVLTELLDRNVDDISMLPKAELDEICRVANAQGALATTKRGAIASLPTREELGTFLRQQQGVRG